MRGFASRRQRGQIGVDDRVLQLRQRQQCGSLAAEAWVRTGQHQTVPGPARPRPAGDRERGLPHPLDRDPVCAGYSVSPPGIGSPFRAPRRRARFRSKRSPRCSPSSSNPANAVGLPPLPTPSSSRPPLIRSSTMASSATRTGNSSGSVTDPGAETICATSATRDDRETRTATAARPHVRGNGVARPRQCRYPKRSA
jgi:hypothetical protein